ncbi:MAG: hypothetical protein H7X88_11515, partial [Gloeobacteraceae cyanobacterium ES-bin-316]|nr:hypothetical protein [Ferruginibacter sp.]
MKSLFMTILFTGMLLCARAQDPIYPPAPAAAQNIVAAEYFIDNDPGFGVATPVPVTPALNITNIPTTVNLTGLTNGVHRLMMRTRSNTGVWSTTTIRDFLYDFNPVYTNPLTAQNIVAAEYFIDTDPGPGAATAIAITPGINLNTVPVTVITAGLSNGIHRLFIRSKNLEGSWSIASIKDFLIDFDFAYPLSPATSQNIVAAEYFIN